jgi:hypothetical protein
MFNLFAEAQLTNPLAVDFADIPGFVKGILSIVMYIGVPFIGLHLYGQGLNSSLLVANKRTSRRRHTTSNG